MNEKLRDLPVKERIQIVEDLWDSIASDQKTLPLTRDQKIELDRRLNAYKTDRNNGRLANDVMLDVRRKL